MVEQIDPEQARTRMGGGASIIDVREEHEWRDAHVEGSLHFPLSRFAATVGELPEGELILICRSGARSQQAAHWLAIQGRTVANLRGGIQAWWAAGLPVTHER